MAKYCVKCGYQMEDEDLVCGECGTPAAVLREDSPETVPSKKLALPGKYLKYGAIILIVLVILIVAISGRQTTVKLDEYVEITFEGYEGYGKAHAEFDYDAFYADYSDKIEYVEENEMTEFIPAAEAFEAFCISGSLDINSGLSNGDQVTYTWSCDDALAETKFDVKLKYNDISAKASGLEKIEAVDLFEDVEIVCSGTDGYGTVDVKTTGKQEWQNEVTYSIDSRGGISNGDIVTVTADIFVFGSDLDTYFAQKYGMIPESFEKEYQVSGLSAIEEFDPFEYIDVSFSGTSPNGEVSISIDRSKAYMERLVASADKTSGLKNGDEITVTLDLEVLFYDGTTENYLAENYGVKATTLSQTYTVEGLPQYIASLDEIPSETMEALKSEAEDKIIAHCNADWQYPEAYGGTEYVGAYLLTAKDPTKSNCDANIIVLVYCISVDSYTTWSLYGPEDPFEMYYCVPSFNLVLNNDGTCVANDTISYMSRVQNEMFYKARSIYYGYETLDALFGQCVQANLDDYSYETDIAKTTK